MQSRVGIFPEVGDQPHATMSGTQEDIPVLDLAVEQYPGIQIAWHHDMESAAAYFDALAVAAADLAGQIRATMTQAEEVVPS
jgi:hypothetical protein